MQEEVTQKTIARLFAKRNIFFNFRLTFPGKEVYNCF